MEEVKNACLQFTAESTILGLSKIFRNSGQKYSLPMTILWLFLTLFLTIYCLVSIVETVEDYNKNDVIGQEKKIIQTSAVFPAITICSLDPLDNISELVTCWFKSHPVNISETVDFFEEYYFRTKQ